MTPSIITTATQLTSAHVLAGNLSPSDTPQYLNRLIRDLTDLLAARTSTITATNDNGDASLHAHPTPAVPIEDSITADHLICLEDGKHMKMLKRYLRTNFGMSPEDYRAKWNLPPDYPMIAPSYREKKRIHAKAARLGHYKRHK